MFLSDSCFGACMKKLRSPIFFSRRTLIIWEMLDECLLFYNTSYVLDNIFFHGRRALLSGPFEFLFPHCWTEFGIEENYRPLKFCTAAEIKRTGNGWELIQGAEMRQ